MIIVLFSLFVSYIIIGLFIAILGSRYIYSNQKNHDSGIKEVKEYFLYFFLVWPIFGLLLLLDYAEENEVIDNFLNFIIGYKKND